MIKVIIGFINSIISKFNKKKEEIVPSDMLYGINRVNRYISCKIEWADKENVLYMSRHNLMTNKHDRSDLMTFPANPIPSLQLQIPTIVYYTYWKKLLLTKYSNLIAYTIEFGYYMTDAKMYTVIMSATTSKNKQICDSFASTPKEYIPPDDLLSNIMAFLDFANKK
jgi:hypothetical protein